VPERQTQQTSCVLDHPEDPTRLVRVRVEGPTGYLERGEGLGHVLVMHGFKGFMHWGFFPELSRRIAEAGLVAVSLNVSGSGIGEALQNFTEEEAFAHNTYSKDLEDLELVRAHVLSGLGCVARGRLGAFGHSRGGGMVLLHAARHGDYKALVTWAAIDEVDRFDAAAKAEWRERGYTLIHNARTGQDHRLDLDVLEDVEAYRSELDILAACSRIDAPTLVVHGTADPAVEFAAGERIAAAMPAAAARLMAIEGAAHTFGATHPQGAVGEELDGVLTATVAHFREHLQ